VVDSHATSNPTISDACESTYFSMHSYVLVLEV